MRVCGVPNSSSSAEIRAPSLLKQHPLYVPQRERAGYNISPLIEVYNEGKFVPFHPLYPIVDPDVIQEKILNCEGLNLSDIVLGGINRGKYCKFHHNCRKNRI